MSATKDIRLTRGDAFTAVVRLNIAGFDWSGVVVRCQLRTPDSRLIWDFSSESGIATEVDTNGKFVITLNAPGTGTRGWTPGRLEADVEVQKASEAWGPYTPAAFRVIVTQDQTR